jgi:chemotaxis regulatin CheY-phosphate phosphatase CheZ
MGINQIKLGAKERAEQSFDEGMGSENMSSYVRTQAQEMKKLNEEKKVQKRAEVTARVKERLQFVVQNAIKRYERVITQVNNSNIDEEKKPEIISQIEAQIEKLNALLVELENVNDITELKNVMKQVRASHSASLGLVRQSISGVYEDRLNKVVEKMNIAVERVSGRVEAMEDGERKDYLKTQVAEAQELIGESLTSIESGNLMEAKENLLAARIILIQIVEELRLIS